MKKYFHSFNFYAFSFSVLLYLLSPSINVKGAEWGLSYVEIGLINFGGSIFYVSVASTLGRIGDRIGFKKSLAIGMIAMAVFLNLGFFWKGVADITLFAFGMNLFFGFFFPSLEGLISKGERREGIDPLMTVIRFVLSWSAGNIVGMALGPYLIQKMPQVVFIYGILLSVTSSVMIFISAKRCNESLPGPYSERLKRPMPQADFPRIKEYRRSYRLAFLLAGIIYTSGMALFPKLISASGLPLEKIGFLTVGANVGVFLSFLFMSRFNFWIGNPGKTLMIMLVIFSATVLSFFMPQTAPVFFAVTFLCGVTYAVPYIFAIFYGLNSQDNDHGKQGGVHESMVGIIFGVGPLIGGYFLQVWPDLKSVGVMSLILISMIFIDQIHFIGKVKSNS